jgi:hypothetical protein
MTNGVCESDVDDLPGCGVEREPDLPDSLRAFGAVVQHLREHAGLRSTRSRDPQ